MGAQPPRGISGAEQGFPGVSTRDWWYLGVHHATLDRDPCKRVQAPSERKATAFSLQWAEAPLEGGQSYTLPTTVGSSHPQDTSDTNARLFHANNQFSSSRKPDTGCMSHSLIHSDTEYQTRRTLRGPLSCTDTELKPWYPTLLMTSYPLGSPTTSCLGLVTCWSSQRPHGNTAATHCTTGFVERK